MVRNIFYISTIFYSLFFVMESVAQQEPTLITQKSGTTYLYQSRELSNGVEMDIYRKEGDDSYKKLNKQPIERIKNGVTFRSAIGEELYQQLTKDLQTDNAIATYLNLINNPELQRLLSFASPKVAEALGFLYIDESSESAKQYTYKIVYRQGNDSTSLDEVVLTHNSKASVPEAPIGLGMSFEDEKISITWDMETDNIEPYISGFHVYAESPDGEVSQLNERLLLHTGSENQLFVFSLPFDNTTYKFFMKAQDITGQKSKRSEELTVTLKDQTAPSPVAGLVANSLKGQPSVITWNVNLESDLKGYNVYRAPRTIDPFVKINEEVLSPYNNFYRDETAKPGQKYAYAVTAIDSSGNESSKSSRATVFIEDYEEPDAPSNLTARYNETSEKVELAWEYEFKQKDFRTFQLTRQVVRKRGKSSFETVNPKALRETNFIDMGPTGEGFLPGYVYNYHVIAIDSSSNASDTASVVFQIPDLDPPAPPEVTAKNDNGIRVNITWTASVDYDVVAYKVYRSLDGKDSLLSKDHYSQRLYRDESVQVGNTYIYTVTAVDSLGNEGVKSVADTILMKDFNPPAPTRNVFAVANSDGVSLEWEQVADKDLAGYMIYKSEIATGIYQPIIDQPIMQESYLDANGAAGDWYKVKAVDSSGNEAYVKSGVQAVNSSNQ